MSSLFLLKNMQISKQNKRNKTSLEHDTIEIRMENAVEFLTVQQVFIFDSKFVSVCLLTYSMTIEQRRFVAR
jgi:hypothetical protein